MVLVDRRNLTIKVGNNRSLSNKYIGPYKIIDKKGTHAYKLEIPTRMHLHNIIHVSLLKPDKARKAGQMNLDDEDEPLYNVEQSINSRQFRSGNNSTVKYLIRWEGFGEKHDTWQPIDTLIRNGIQNLIVGFHKKLGNRRKAVHPDIEPLL